MFSRFVCGDSFELTTSVAAYPASAGWQLSFRFIRRDATTGTPIEIACTADGDNHVAEVAAAVTADWTPGEYTWTSWVADGAVEHTVESGLLTLQADPRVATAGFDLRTEAVIALAEAKAALAAWKPTVKQYQIAGRMMIFNSPAEILKVISYWENQVRAERAAGDRAAGRADRRKVYGRLARA